MVELVSIVEQLFVREKLTMNKEQLIFKNGCWDCKRAIEDPNEQYICPNYQQHLIEYRKYE